MYKIIFPILSLALLSCNKDDNNITPENQTYSNIWDNVSDAELLNMPSYIQRIEISQSNESGETNGISSIHEFNHSGRITSYRKGFNYNLETRTDIIDSYTMNMISNIATYTYEYDDKERLSYVTIDEDGILSQYEITYSDHSRYIPAIFAVGDLSFYLIKGVEQITLSDITDPNDKSLLYTFKYEGNTASYTVSHGWLSRETTVKYYYNSSSDFPVSKTAVTTYFGEKIFDANCEYTFDLFGRLLKEKTAVTTILDTDYWGNIDYVAVSYFQVRSKSNSANTLNYERDLKSQIGRAHV